MHPDKQVPAINNITRLPYHHTGYFSGIVADYLQGAKQLQPFYQYSPDLEGIQKAILDRKEVRYNREVLVQVLTQQYTGLLQSDRLQKNLRLLLSENTYTITTAHQPNIFSGPLYFIYKIMHAIRLADQLKAELPVYDFVPIFYMGSEDADLDELGHFTVEGKKYQWQTNQTGAVGRMKIDKAFLQLIDELSGQIQVHPHGDQMIGLFRHAYREGVTVQEGTLRLVNDLFGEYGLVVLIPDNAELKRLFNDVVGHELQERFSHKAVENSIRELGKNYKVQAGGRELNLFYLLDDKRERIEIQQDGFAVPALGLRFTAQEMMDEVEQHPGRFSANVILRGVFQEKILPNIVFIGGGGEIAYWLELKGVFKESRVPFPVLVLRNSFWLLNARQQGLIEELGISIPDSFKHPDELLNDIVKRNSINQVSLSEEIGELNSFYQQLHESAFRVDPTLAEHVNALQAQAVKRLTSLERKLLRAEKRKFDTEKRKIYKLKETAFPGGSLQERVENVSGFYARTGRSLLQRLYDASPALERSFTILPV